MREFRKTKKKKENLLRRIRKKKAKKKNKFLPNNNSQNKNMKKLKVTESRIREEGLQFRKKKPNKMTMKRACHQEALMPESMTL
jgi:hypothetical protein